MALKAVYVVSRYFEGAKLIEGVEMTVLEEGRPRKFPVCVCNEEGPGADRIIADLREQLPADEQGPMGVFGDRYPQFRKIFVFCRQPEAL